MASKQADGGRVLTDLISSHGWDINDLADAVGVSESLIRKYASGNATRPQGAYVTRIARAFGSTDGAKMLFAFGLDVPARNLAAQDVEPLSPFEVPELPQPVALTIDERLTRLEEQVNQIFERLVGSSDAKPGYIRPAGVAPVITLPIWADRPMQGIAPASSVA